MNIRLIQGDITATQADAIVNAANQTLMGGGGVDGAIHRKGGPAILEACIKIRDAQGGCPTGQAVITTAGRLPAKWVIHTVGPVYGGDLFRKAQLLRSCYLNSLKLAAEHGAKTVAFPNISTGVYRYPKQEAAEIAIQAVRAFEPGDALDEVMFVCFDNENYAIYQQLL